MTNEQLDQILAAIKAVEVAVSARAATTTATAPKREYTYTPPNKDEVIEPPSALVDDPGSVEISFGKNKGVKIRDLAPASLKFYAGAGWVFREKNSGGFWPGDVALKDAARQYWHLKHGAGATAGAATVSRPKPTEPELANQAATATENVDVPF